ncbi:MAG: DUF6159 family protein [Thermoplasmata archaeon]|nr:DUF6159 family protein [Thermoplasmata archaeon]
MGRWSDSVRITKTVLRTLREDRALLVLPLLSGLCMIAAAAVLFVPLLLAFLLNPSGLIAFATSMGGRTVLAILALVLYFVLVFLSNFFFAALIGAATIKLGGRTATVRDGLQIASSKLGRLVVWSLIAGTVGLLIRLIASRFKGIVGLLIAVGAGISWSVATYFVLPVILYEENTAWRSLVRSAKLFTTTFGRWFFSNLLLGLLVAGIFLLGVLPFIAGILLLGSSTGLGLGLLLLGVIVWIFALVFSTTVNGIMRAVLYRYATTGQIDPAMAPSTLPPHSYFASTIPPPPPLPSSGA